MKTTENFLNFKVTHFDKSLKKISFLKSHVSSQKFIDIITISRHRCTVFPHKTYVILDVSRLTVINHTNSSQADFTWTTKTLIRINYYYLVVLDHCKFNNIFERIYHIILWPLCQLTKITPICLSGIVIHKRKNSTFNNSLLPRTKSLFCQPTNHHTSVRKSTSWHICVSGWGTESVYLLWRHRSGSDVLHHSWWIVYNNSVHHRYCDG
jgi:hypothetical protein